MQHSPNCVDAATALAKLQPSFTAAVTSAYAAAATGADLSSLQADDVTNDRPTADAACMRRVQGDVGGGRLNTGESLSLVNRRTQQLLPCFSALEMKCAARPGFDPLIEK
jgi:hypothetical protein